MNASTRSLISAKFGRSTMAWQSSRVFWLRSGAIAVLDMIRVVVSGDCTLALKAQWDSNIPQPRGKRPVFAFPAAKTDSQSGPTGDYLTSCQQGTQSRF